MFRVDQQAWGTREVGPTANCTWHLSTSHFPSRSDAHHQLPSSSSSSSSGQEQYKAGAIQAHNTDTPSALQHPATMQSFAPTSAKPDEYRGLMDDFYNATPAQMDPDAVLEVGSCAAYQQFSQLPTTQLLNCQHLNCQHLNCSGLRYVRIFDPSTHIAG